MQRGERALPDAAPLSPLLVVCARVAAGTATTTDLERAVRATRDWDTVLRQSAAHRLSPFLHKQLAGLDPALAPPQVTARFLDLYRAGVRRGLFMATQMLRLLDLFSAAGVTALPYKGPVLAVQAYGDVGLRAPADLDFLVARDDVPRAVQVLRDQGFTRMGEWPPHRDVWVLRRLGELTFVSDGGDFIVELHTRVGFALESSSIPSEHLLVRAASVEVLGRTIVAPSIDDTLLMLCTHASRHEWARLEWVLSAGRVMRVMTSGQWRGFLDEAERWGCVRRGLVGARVVGAVLGVQPPPEIEAAAARDRLGSAIARATLRQLRGGRGDGVGSDLRELALLGLSEDTLAAAAEHVVRRLFTPSVEDWSSVEFGPGLTALYWPYRVLRLARKYGGKAAAEGVRRRHPAGADQPANGSTTVTPRQPDLGFRSSE